MEDLQWIVAKRLEDEGVGVETHVISHVSESRVIKNSSCKEVGHEVEARPGVNEDRVDVDLVLGYLWGKRPIKALELDAGNEGAGFLITAKEVVQSEHELGAGRSVVHVVSVEENYRPRLHGYVSMQVVEGEHQFAQSRSIDKIEYNS